MNSNIEPLAARSFDHFWGRVLVLLGISTYAVGQPFVSLLSGNAELFTYHNFLGRDAIAFICAILIAPALLSIVVGECAIRFFPRRGKALHFLLVLLFSHGTFLEIAKQGLGLEGVTLAIISSAAAFSATAAYWLWEPVSYSARLLAIMAPSSLVSFLFFTETGDLVRADLAINKAANGEQASVVVQLLDELPTQSVLNREGSINPHSFPHLAAFAQQATWYPNYTVAATLTNKAVPGLLTSSLNIRKRGLFTHYPNNLMTLMANTHQSHVFETFTRMCHLENCEGLEPHSELTSRFNDFANEALGLFAHRMSLREAERDKSDFEEKTGKRSETVSPTVPILERYKGIEAARGLRLSSAEPERFGRFLSTFEKDQPSSFHLLHLLLPHQPWRYYANGSFYSTPLFGNVQTSYPFRRNNDEAWLSVLTEYRHLLQSFYTDSLIGAMVARLKQTGLWENSLIIVTADHGISFEKNTPIRTLERKTLDALAYVPLLVKYPQQKAGIVNRANVSAMDVLPTIADVVGTKVPFPIEGLSLLHPDIERRNGIKKIIDVEDKKGQPIRGIIEFSMQDTPPQSKNRWLADVQRGEEPITVLNEWLGISDLVGLRFDDVLKSEKGRKSTDGVASIRDQDVLEALGEPAPALVVGKVDHPKSDQGTVLLVIDGVIATGSPVIEFDNMSNAYVAFIPQQWAGKARSLSLGFRTHEGEVVRLKVD